MGAPEVGTPKEFPQVSPAVDLYPTSDIRFVMIELGKLSTKVDRLISDGDKNSDKLSELSKKVATFETTTKVAAALLTAFAIFIWWVMGDIIKTAVSNSVRSAIIESAVRPQPAAANTPSTPGSPVAPAPKP
jgi:hypothetical protein